MTDRTAQERANGRRYGMHMVGASVLYLGLLFVPPLLMERHSGLGVVLALLPLLAVAWMLLAVVQFVRNLDEYFRPRVMTASAIAFAVAMLTALALGMLDAVLGPWPWAIWGVFIAGMLAWGTAIAVLSARGNR